MRSLVRFMRETVYLSVCWPTAEVESLDCVPPEKWSRRTSGAARSRGSQCAAVAVNSQLDGSGASVLPLPDDCDRWKFPSQVGAGQFRLVTAPVRVGSVENADCSRRGGDSLLTPDGPAAVSLAKVDYVPARVELFIAGKS
jgi:hypothetical protein